MEKNNSLDPLLSDLGLGFIPLVIVLFLILLAILWFILPFAVFGIKRRLDSIILINRRIDNNLESIKYELEKGSNSKVSLLSENNNTKENKNVDFID